MLYNIKSDLGLDRNSGMRYIDRLRELIRKSEKQCDTIDALEKQVKELEENCEYYRNIILGCQRCTNRL